MLYNLIFNFNKNFNLIKKKKKIFKNNNIKLHLFILKKKYYQNNLININNLKKKLL